MAHVLDGYAYPLDPMPGVFTGVRQLLPRADLPTFGGNISLYWDAVWPDTVVREEWEQMDGAQFRTLQAKYEAGGGGLLYLWTPGDGRSYQVEITGLDGRPYKADTYVRVSMTLKVHQQVG